MSRETNPCEECGKPVPSPYARCSPECIKVATDRALARHPSNLSRTRARRVDDLVLEIMGEMSAGRWNGAALEQIAIREHVDISSAKDWATDAGRMLRLSSREMVPALRARNIARLDEVYVDAGADSDHKARIGATAEQNKLLGLIVEKHEVTGSFTEDKWVALRSRIMAALEPFPEASAAVIAALKEA